MFVFFKQKTAYEMRISDWSSDVCSSDLHNSKDAAEEVAAGIERAITVQADAAVSADIRRLYGTAVTEFGQVDIVVNNAAIGLGGPLVAVPAEEIGRASCRERVCQYVSISVDAVTLNKKKKQHTNE